ncbi:uncharacterized protein LOC100906904 [Galendromus occidentalis]|uniref:nicotinamidase n=1 Tax=Galendromus occidentalis TaxID=34638 RepID=A0AAJ7PBA7_9ACAR|nr:uncharacterized protein LOC100906904 [Galendromus occidentalis]
METFERTSEGNDTVSLHQLTEFLRNTYPRCDDDEKFGARAHHIFKKYGGTDALSRDGFLCLWNTLLEKCIKPKSALVVVDYQNDFIDGSLSLKKCPLGDDPELLLPRLNEFIVKSDEVVYSLDWHPEDHISFIECRNRRKTHESNRIDPGAVKVAEELFFEIQGRPYIQKMWPRHCVQHSEGARLHKDLVVKEGAIFVYKGTDPEVDSYSAFWDNRRSSKTNLKESLLERGITNLIVVGLAFDACVLFTALDAIREGFTTCVVRELTSAISEATIEEAVQKLTDAHCPRISFDAAYRMLSGGPLPWIFVWQQACQVSLVRDTCCPSSPASDREIDESD